ncbi:lactonase family protein [Maribacter sp. R77961]|uniref:lactonase family protein n=1 Tax=Maribacter sp. R77961 TaxID=3093871 RepID=UPI0037CC29FA
MKHYFKFLAILLVLSSSCISKSSKTLLFVGSYTEGKPSDGIHVYELNTASGELHFLAKKDSLVNPSFLKIAPSGDYLYAVLESQLPTHGKIASFAVDSLNGTLDFLNSQDAGGRNPVHIAIHANGNYLVNSNYTDAGISLFEIQTDGSLSAALEHLIFKDSSIVKGRQDEAHLHSTNFSPDGEFLFGQDLGADKIRRFTEKNWAKGNLDLTQMKPIKVKPGSGPRHFTFHPNGKFGYGLSELNGIITVYEYSHGDLRFLEEHLSYATKQEIYRAADIHISPDGKFLYASNRGPKEDSIAIFSIDQETGKLLLVGHEPTYGKHPRNFCIDPSGKFLLVANQFSDKVVIYRRDLETGELIKLGQELIMNNPSSLQMYTYETY